MMKAFVRMNRAASDRFGRRFRHLGSPLEQTFLDIVDDVLRETGSSEPVLDIGAGRSSPLVPRVKAANRTLVCVDISPEELRQNRETACRLAADAARLPFADASVNLLVSRFLIEHLPDSRAFLRETHRLLAPGGRAIHILPNARALYVLVSRLLPKSWAARLVHLLLPWSKGTLGFPAYYDRCTLGELRKAFESLGLVVERVEYGYDQSFYVRSFTPLFALVVLHDALLSRLRATLFCTSFAIVVRKP